MEAQDIITYFAKEIAKHIQVQAPEKEEEAMTIKEVEDFLQVSRSKVYEVVKSEGFPAYKVGSEFRILKSELIEWMKNQKEGV